MATILGAWSSGAAAISCKELKKLPIEELKFESPGNNMFSRSETWSE